MLEQQVEEENKKKKKKNFISHSQHSGDWMLALGESRFRGLVTVFLVHMHSSVVSSSTEESKPELHGRLQDPSW